MTSIVVLERALEICGFGVKVDGKNLGRASLFEELKSARARIKKAGGVEEIIAAYEAYVSLIESFDHESSLPQQIRLEHRDRYGYIYLERNLLGYVARGDGNSSLRIPPLEVRRGIANLNGAYKLVARQLSGAYDDAVAGLANARQREAMRKMVEAERAAYKESVKKAKEKIHETIVANAKKEGYKVKKNVYRKGKHAGREQYVVVKRV